MGQYIIAGKTIKQWSAETGLSVRLIQKRFRDNPSLDDIFKPIRKQVPSGSIKAQVEQLAKKECVSEKAIYQRIARGAKLPDLANGKKNCSLRQSVELCIRRGENLRDIIGRHIDKYSHAEILKCHDEVQTVNAASKKLGLSRDCLYGRFKIGWSKEEILNGERVKQKSYYIVNPHIRRPRPWEKK